MEQAPLCCPKASLDSATAKDLHIEAFDDDSIYPVTADLFNDPYDTLVRDDMGEFGSMLIT